MTTVIAPPAPITAVTTITAALDAIETVPTIRQRESQEHEAFVQAITQALWMWADTLDHCSVFDNIMSGLGLPRRYRREVLSRTASSGHLRVRVSGSATSASQCLCPYVRYQVMARYLGTTGLTVLNCPATEHVEGIAQMPTKPVMEWPALPAPSSEHGVMARRRKGRVPALLVATHSNGSATLVNGSGMTTADSDQLRILDHEPVPHDLIAMADKVASRLSERAKAMTGKLEAERNRRRRMVKSIIDTARETAPRNGCEETLEPVLLSFDLGPIPLLTKRTIQARVTVVEENPPQSTRWLGTTTAVVGNQTRVTTQATLRFVVSCDVSECDCTSFDAVAATYDHARRRGHGALNLEVHEAASIGLTNRKMSCSHPSMIGTTP